MKFKKITTIIGAILFTAPMIVSLSSCESIYDELDPCPVNLRFVYEYNMEYANAFPSKVDCLTLLVYDEKGNFITKRTETSDVLKDENYRMVVDDLEKGNYHLIAYGGMACGKQSFTMSPEPAANTQMQNLQVSLPVSESRTSDKQLHNLYFGESELVVTGEDRTEKVVKMIKDTNNIRIVLQQLSAQNVSDSDFSVRITDDNTLMDYKNAVVPNGEVTYFPWIHGEQTVNGTINAQDKVKVAFSELSVARLMESSKARLIITLNENGKEIVNIPLIDYLMLLKGSLYAEMGAQEFLDRQSEWALVFFLDSKNEWVTTQIIINDWIIRLNDVEI